MSTPQTCRPSGAWVLGGSRFLYTCRPAGAKKLDIFLDYTHCGPPRQGRDSKLERKTEYFSFNRKPTDFQRIATCVNTESALIGYHGNIIEFVGRRLRERSCLEVN